MQFSEQWLREWVKVSDPLEVIAEKLTLCGLESDGITKEATDKVIAIDFTPNRGDCLSIRGLAREISAVCGGQYAPITITPVTPKSTATRGIQIIATEGCSQYVGRRIDKLNSQATTPAYMADRLNQQGSKCIHPVVDCLNYVMMELGQPMHAFDNAHLHGDVCVRFAKAGETITLLDDRQVELDTVSLVIADERGPVALAGIMGGLDSAVSQRTESIFLESAYFVPAVVSKKARQLGIVSDAAYRYERGVDPLLACEAMERATQLILDICGGEAGPLIERTQPVSLRSIVLRHARIQSVLGLDVTATQVADLLQQLGCELSDNAAGWQVTVPSWRSDIQIEVDLIEEIGRLVGYDRLPHTHLPSIFQFAKQSEQQITNKRIKNLLLDRGYSEVITYSFVSPSIQKLIAPEIAPLEISNPISSEMSVMRTTLWSGLLQTAQYNCNRQQQDLAIFEMGLKFIPGKTLQQIPMIAGLIVGKRFALNWADAAREVDFYDIKGDVEALLSLGDETRIRFVSGTSAALHPYQAAEIVCDERVIGQLGAIHPAVLKTLEISGPAYAFEIQLDSIPMVALPHYQSVGRFPTIRRDLAFIVDSALPVSVLIEEIQTQAGALLSDCAVFDVYQGTHMPANKKSIALALTLSDKTKTLVDEEVNTCIERIVQILYREHQAVLREGV